MPLIILNLVPPVSCEWSLWQTGDCSVSCGEGVQTKRRTKTFNNETPIGKCQGQGETEVPCTKESCPGKLLTLNFLNRQVFVKKAFLNKLICCWYYII